MTKFSSLKPGSILSEGQYYSVEKIVGDKIQLKNDHDESIVVNKQYVENCLNSADQFSEVLKLTRTEVAAQFLSKTNIAMTVNFNKQVKEPDVVKEIQDAYEGSTPKEFADKMKTAVKKALEGVERTMIGRHYGHVNEFGRVNFIDMEEVRDTSKKEYDSRTRNCDPRTINYFICEDIKYMVK